MSESTELTTVEPQPQSQRATDLRSFAMATVSPKVMAEGLANYSELRLTFRRWLLGEMQKGVHYGFTPGCEPKTKVIDGVPHFGVWMKGRGDQKGEMRWYPETQWKPKESLYKAGADFVCDTLNVIDVYDADMDAWQQLGGPRGTFVYRCRLYPKGAAQVPENMIGEGRGVRKCGQKGGDENNAIKMAKKSAKVDAVLNGYGLSDLFTQDLEDLSPEPHDNPSQNPDAPQVPPRAKRANQPTVEELTSLLTMWKGMCDQAGQSDTDDEWAAFVEDIGGVPRASARNRNAWTREAYDACETAIRRKLGTLEPEDIDG